MQQQPLPAIEKAQTNEVVIDKCPGRVEDCIAQKCGDRLAVAAAVVEQLGDLAAVTVHVLQINAQRRIGIVKHVVLELASGTTELRSAMRTNPFAKTCRAAPEETQFAVWVESAVPNPAAEVEVKPRNPVGAEFRLSAEQLLNLGLQFRGKNLIGVEQQRPIGSAKVKSNVLLFAVAAKRMVARLCAEGLSNLEGAVPGARIDNDNFVSPANALEGVRQIRLLVHGDHGNGQGLAHRRKDKSAGSCPPNCIVRRL